jgi:hypothetical protein
MTKLLVLPVLALLLTSCQENCPSQSGEVQTETQVSVAANATCPEPTPDPIPDPLPDPDGDVPNEALTFSANYVLTNFEGADEEKLARAIEIIKSVVASREFRARVLGFTYNGKRQFVDNKGLSNQQIYDTLLAGREDLRPEVDNEMDLELELYYSWRNVVGYTTPGELRIYMNTKFFDPYTPSEVAGNVFHEWTHKLGFDHASSPVPGRDASVPYAIGYMIEELGKQYE